ncbi:HIT family protein [Microvirga thermotolerans]|uniref:HIT domain-containing protein n=1 Tax=Microvirga thermotolerans TaxID=2651334 RepID=A0A5P9K126_9HYPH|nr:HIT family protein [Microvirga thermotolerans]QFU15934.1 HIT domain-containing protein [Microvirga thermotolerans]
MYDETNVFARILRNELPCHKVYETGHVLAFMDVMPRSDGHILVIPKAKVRTIFDIADEDLQHLFRAVQLISRAAMEAMSSDGVSLIQSNESAAGQVVFHMHVHVIPRWTGVEMRPHTSAMEEPEVLESIAARYRRVIEQMDGR